MEIFSRLLSLSGMGFDLGRIVDFCGHPDCVDLSHRPYVSDERVSPAGIIPEGVFRNEELNYPSQDPPQELGHVRSEFNPIAWPGAAVEKLDSLDLLHFGYHREYCGRRQPEVKSSLGTGRELKAS